MLPVNHGLTALKTGRPPGAGDGWRKHRISAAVLAAGMAAWILSLRLSHRMPMHPAGFVAVWTLMMLAMMAPSVLPTVLLFAGAAGARAHGRRPAPTAAFVAGYLAAWALVGAAVAALRSLAGLEAWNRPLAAAALGLAGAYQLTRWKAACLTHCRSPLHFFLAHWREGPFGALSMGAHHGLYCVGCCAGLMVALMALGLMNPLWMVSIALVILMEKVVPDGDRLAVPTGLALVALAAAVALGWTPPAPPMGGM